MWANFAAVFLDRRSSPFCPSNRWSRVIHAYQERCAVCRLPFTELLDAAHIRPDKSLLAERFEKFLEAS
jgi:hypothetical protein